MGGLDYYRGFGEEDEDDCCCRLAVVGGACLFVCVCVCLFDWEAGFEALRACRVN